MVRITYIEADGREQLVDVECGSTVMEGARNAGIEGILADCGGNCACGTCRVYVDLAWREKVGEAHDDEAATIEAHEEALPGTRLSCQIQVTEKLDGLIVRMPNAQF